MKRIILRLLCLLLIGTFTGCATTYKAAPVPFKSPTAFGNMVNIDGAEIAAKAYGDKMEASKAFGFDIVGAGMLPVQVVFNNKSQHTFEVNGEQSFLEDDKGNLWPILSREMAYERASRHTQTDQMMSKGASSGLLGAAAGAIVGAAIGIVFDGDVGEAMGKGAVIGGTAGMISGGSEGYHNQAARRAISKDLRAKSLQNKTILPNTIAYGILFYPSEASLSKNLHLYLVETDTGKSHRLMFDLSNKE
jgi:hypothetical protein